MDDRQRAEDNERLRLLAAEELAAMRVELARALEDRVELHKDLNSLAERLSEQENLTLEEGRRATELQAELDRTRRELADALSRIPIVIKPLSLKRRMMNLVPKRLRKYGKRIVKSLPNSSNAR